MTGAKVPIPAGMIEVTKDQFFSALYKDPRDIMPSNRNPNYTTWETRDRAVWGWSSPGWKNPGDPAVWAIAQRSKP
jgi:hypothetical protein